MLEPLFNKVEATLLKRTPTQVFSCAFCKIYLRTYISESIYIEFVSAKFWNLQTTASDWVILNYAMSHNEPQQTTNTHNEPQRTTTTHNEPQQVTTNHNHPQQATRNHNHPQWATTNHNHPQWDTAIHNEPQRATTSHNEPQRATTIHN